MDGAAILVKFPRHPEISFFSLTHGVSICTLVSIDEALSERMFEDNGYILLKKVLHHLIFTTFLSNVFYKYTKNILNIILPWRVGLVF